MPLDKNEGGVKGKVVLAGAQHRLGLPLSHVREQDSGKNLTLITVRWRDALKQIVPPTIDTSYTATMILLCEHPAPRGMRERPINPAV